MPSLLSDIAHHWFNGVANDLGRYVIFSVAVWLLLWVLLASVLSSRRIRAERPPARQLLTEFLISTRSVMIFSTIGVGSYFLSKAGAYPLPDLAAKWGLAWFAASFVITIVVHDAYIYWTHRIMHHPRLFRRFHLRHHRSSNPSPFTAYSFDIREALVMVAFGVTWPLLFPVPWIVAGLFSLYQIVRNTLLHCGYELMPARKDGRPWLDFMTTTTHHDLHHGYAGYNYAAWFTWWDRWMGTEHPEYHARYAAAVGRTLAPRGRTPELANA